MPRAGNVQHKKESEFYMRSACTDGASLKVLRMNICNVEATSLYRLCYNKRSLSDTQSLLRLRGPLTVSSVSGDRFCDIFGAFSIR